VSDETLGGLKIAGLVVTDFGKVVLGSRGSVEALVHEGIINVLIDTLSNIVSYFIDVSRDVFVAL